MVNIKNKKVKTFYLRGVVLQNLMQMKCVFYLVDLLIDMYLMLMILKEGNKSGRFCIISGSISFTFILNK